MQSIIIILVIVLLINIIILVRVIKSQSNGTLQSGISDLQHSLARIENSLKEDFRVNRQESAMSAKSNREELSESLKNMAELSQAALLRIEGTLDVRIQSLSTKMDHNNAANRQEINKNIQDFTAQSKEDNRINRETLISAFRDFQKSFDDNIRSFNDLQREKFAQLENRQNDLVKSTEAKLEGIRSTVEEKLEKTLSERLGQSFDTVGKQLLEVQKGLGEMQTLAQDVGGLKRVLSNVKMRGGFGEVQLHMLLENILAPDQYEANVITKSGGNERVEFAVKFPNKEGDREFIWLPIDAKFPKDAYEHLQTAYDQGDLQIIENAQKNLETVIRKMARDICNKYIDVPGTTNFGIMFLPFEGLFAEVVRKASLLEEIQRECNVVITGPTTLAVILNSLQMGFRTLAIQKRSSEVWKILGAVKKEFNLFGGMLGKAQKNIQTGLNQLDDVVGVRTRAIQRQLRNIETTEEPEVTELPDLPDSLFSDDIPG